MKLQNYPRIVKENLPEKFRDIVDSFTGFNSLAEDLSNAFNKNITVDDNLNMQYKQLEVTLNGSGIPTITTEFKSTLRNKSRGVIIVRAENLTNPSVFPTNAPFITFSEEQQVITINHITGLPANNKYRLTLLSVG